MQAAVVHEISRLEAFVRAAADSLALPREAGEFCRALVLATGADRAVEIGTGYGFSTLWIASAIAENGGRLVTIDRDARKSALAQAAAERASLAGCVDWRIGSASDVLDDLAGPINFVLNDADKEHCVDYVKRLLPKLGPRAVVLTDNIHTHAAQLADFVAWVRGLPEFFSTSVAVGNGMELTVRR